MLHIAPWSILAGLIEGQFGSIVISKTFHGSDLMIAVASATPVGAQLFSLVWGMLCIGRPKRTLFTIFGAATVLFTAIAGAIPATPWGAHLFIIQMAAAQIMLAGVVTVRSAVWKLNYPRSHRGQITARIQRLRSIGSVIGMLAAGSALDGDPTSYRYIFPIAAACGAIGIWIAAGIRVRGDKLPDKRAQDTVAQSPAQVNWVEPYSVTALMSPGHVIGQMFRVLRKDNRFLQYCIAQSMTGISNLLTISVAVAVVTRDLDPGDEWGFWISTALLSALSNLAMLGSISRWGRLFDSVGVLRFRVINVVCWAAGLAFGLFGTLAVVHGSRIGAAYFPFAVFMFALRGIANGLGSGGGALAWNLGHLDFAKPEEAEIYMGIHVSLTGLRGLVAPLIGMWLFNHFGWTVWAIGLAFSFCSLYTYASMARYEERMGLDVRSTGS